MLQAHPHNVCIQLGILAGRGGAAQALHGSLCWVIRNQCIHIRRLQHFDILPVGIGRVSKVEEFEVADVESLRLGRDADKIACVVDPAGYYWEVLERHERKVSEALCKVS